MPTIGSIAGSLAKGVRPKMAPKAPKAKMIKAPMKGSVKRETYASVKRAVSKKMGC